MDDVKFYLILKNTVSVTTAAQPYSLRNGVAPPLFVGEVMGYILLSAATWIYSGKHFWVACGAPPIFGRLPKVGGNSSLQNLHSSTCIREIQRPPLEAPNFVFTVPDNGLLG